MNSIEIFTIALGVESPWFIKEINFVLDINKKKELHIYFDFEKGSRFKNEVGDLQPAYDTEERRWEHLNFFEHRCYIHARVPRVKQSDGKFRIVSVPWARAGSGFTLLFEAYAMLLIENEMPINKVSDVLGVVSNRIWRVFNHWIELAVSQDDLSTVKHIGVDETSSKKGHKYITIVADLETNRTIHVTEGKDAETLSHFTEALIQKGGSCSSIKTVSMDMSPAYISGAIEHFYDAHIVFDKFHISQLANHAMDEVRRLEHRNNELLKGHRYTFLHSYQNLTQKKKEELNTLLDFYPTLGEAYKLKQMLKDAWQYKQAEEGMAYLQYWLDIVTDSGIQPFIKLANTIKSHWTGVTNYFKYRFTNATLESINSKVQLAKKRARGFRNINNLKNMTYFLTAKLKFSYPHFAL